jgi:uncharacterized protein (TIGR00251 family)
VITIPFKTSRRGITIKVRVEPRSSRKGVAGIVGDALKIRLNSPPVGGAANKELVEILSEELGIRKTALNIIKGRSSRDKVIEIEGMKSLP